MWLWLLLNLALTTHALVVLPDGRRAHVLKNEDAVSAFIQTRVAELAKASIEERGAFSMSIGSGTTVKPLVALADEIDWSKVFLFFGNERTEGDSAGKCLDGAAELISTCAIPATNVFRVPKVAAEQAAMLYEMSMRGVVPTCEERDLPRLDLVLLGSGADGHCASLYPQSSQVTIEPGSGRAYLPAEGKGGITLSIEAISTARNVLLSAAKPTQADMVRKCLGWSNADKNTAWPAGMISAREGLTEVEWLLTEDSAVELPAL